jgi:hypothetical protein
VSGLPDGPGTPPAATVTGQRPDVLPEPTAPPTLGEVCAAMEDPEMQGLPLLTRDYVLLGLVTVLIPLILIWIGTRA